LPAYFGMTQQSNQILLPSPQTLSSYMNMADLTTTYMGVKLKNPLILGASNLVTKFEVIKELEEAGIAAIVYKSLFEEQIEL